VSVRLRRLFEKFWRKPPSHWTAIYGWFQWRSGQEEAVRHFGDGARFVEVGTFLGRSICSLGELVQQSGKRISVVGVDTCRGSGPEGVRKTDYAAKFLRRGGGTLAGALHRNIVNCGLSEVVSLIVSDSVTAASFFADRSLAWVHIDASHEKASVIADIEAWWPKIQSGGWLSGDDYDETQWPGVVAAVSETLPAARPWSARQWRAIAE